MKTLIHFASAAALAAALAAGAAPAQAAVDLFAHIDTGNKNGSNLEFDSKGASGVLFTTVAGKPGTAAAAAVRFTFFDPALPDFEDVKAAFTLNATVTDTPGEFDGSTFTQTGVDGRFSFIYSGLPETLDGISLVQNVTVLLSGTFENAWVQGDDGVGGLVVSGTNGGSATFKSAVFNPPGVVAGSDEFTLQLGAANFSALDPSTGCNGTSCTHGGSTALNSFTAHAGGDFQDRELAAGVPEPASWALMIVGFGGAGAMLRRRRQLAALAI